MITILLSALLALAIGLLIGARAVMREQSEEIERLVRDMGIARQECQALMESIGRASRMPIQFDRSPKKPLEQLETYYEQRPTIEKITAG